LLDQYDEFPAEGFRPAHIAVVGVGRTGVVTSVGLAHLSHYVTGIDRNEQRIQQLASGDLPETEPGLRSALRSALRHRNLAFAGPGGDATFDIVFLCVDTPPLNHYELDLSQVLGAAAGAAAIVREGGIIATRSTIPAGTGDRIASLLCSLGRPDVAVVHVPEFLREGHAWEDFREPDRIVIGGESPAVQRIEDLFRGLGSPVFRTSRRTAELAKYAANAFLATSVSFANELADISDSAGAEARHVFDIMRADRRIGPHAYLSPGLGFGGHCLPKDITALERFGAGHGRATPLLQAARQVNRARIDGAVAWLRAALGGLDRRRICLLGLAFKPGTDDTRESPALQLARALALEGADVSGWDEFVKTPPPFVTLAESVPAAAEGADALVVAYAAPRWSALDPLMLGTAMRQRVLFDPALALDRPAWTAAGFVTNGQSHRAALLPAGFSETEL